MKPRGSLNTFEIFLFSVMGTRMDLNFSMDSDSKCLKLRGVPGTVHLHSHLDTL